MKEKISLIVFALIVVAAGITLTRIGFAVDSDAVCYLGATCAFCGALLIAQSTMEADPIYHD